MATLQQPNAQNIHKAIRNIVDGRHNRSTEAAQIQMLQQFLNRQRELRKRVRQIRKQWVFPILGWHSGRTFDYALLGSDLQVEPVQY
ncbi:hypothetical protein L873DRAFT_821773 [Choiromyces venosus 120613-1]|uniref:Uncharacterized protein n=1 Tax=Choiromyces venosus 120613-1 TaxID=1336337 RepID=A0A3N4JVU4_9PEZI|nr:hypothetical protein L873DRAFT_821773 [Choiromyces venosus 120613-1]